MNLNLNDPVVKFVVAVITIGFGILLVTIFPIGIFAFIGLIGIIYYLFKKKNT